MRADWSHLDKYRENTGFLASAAGDTFGAFLVHRLDVNLRIIATDGDHAAADLPQEYAWEHVSVSTATRTPTWEEMDRVKRMFWEDHETVMQLHVARADHINCHPHTLHMWRPLKATIPLPPADTVGLAQKSPYE